MARSEADCSRPKRLLRVVLSEKPARADSCLAIRFATGAAGDKASAVELRCPGLRLKAAAVGQSPAPRFRRLQQHGLVRFSTCAGLPAVGRRRRASPDRDRSLPAAAAGKNYQVQYKNDLNDAVWQVLNGSVTIEGNQGFVRDVSGPSPQRFYRIVSD